MEQSNALVTKERAVAGGIGALLAVAAYFTARMIRRFWPWGRGRSEARTVEAQVVNR